MNVEMRICPKNENIIITGLKYFMYATQ